MHRKIWSVGALMAGIFIAAWIYLNLEQRSTQHTYNQVNSVLDQVDSVANSGREPTAVEHVRRPGTSLTQRMRSVNDMQQRPTDSLKKIIEEDNLLGSR